jgi:hypothetical protein
MNDKVIAKLRELHALVGSPYSASFTVTEDEHGTTYSVNLADRSGNSDSTSKRVARQK